MFSSRWFICENSNGFGINAAATRRCTLQV
nr:MAG TPA: hypothetical protein [Bacteriophage sp.]